MKTPKSKQTRTKNARSITGRLRKRNAALAGELEALALLDDWIQAGHQIDLCPGEELSFTGRLTWLNKSAPVSLSFHSVYGIHRPIFPTFYDKIWIEHFDPSLQVVHMEDSLGVSSHISLSVNEKGISTAEISRVCQQFQQWIKLKAKLRLMWGDAMSVAIYDATIHQGPHESVFCFRTKNATYAVTPSQSGRIEIERMGTSTLIQLINSFSGSNFVVTDAFEPPEQMMERFVAVTKVVQ